jgi:hypothetical protein
MLLAMAMEESASALLSAREMPVRQGDSSGPWKSVSTPLCLPGVRAPAYLSRIGNEQRAAIATGSKAMGFADVAVADG